MIFFVTLVGESGAGKSVLLYQIAQELMDKDVTVFRLNVDILRDMSRFEDRLEQRVNSLAAYCGSIAVESDRRVVLILDEMATLHDPKEEGNSLNNYFKMYLELVLHKGFTFQILGATTHHELETFYDADFAMKRRMREISLPRLSQDELVNILKKQAGSYCQQNDITKILAHLTQVNYPAELQLSEAKRLINEGKSTRVPLEHVLTLYHPLPEDADFISTADGSINLDGDSNLGESASRFMYQGGSMPRFPGSGGTPLFPFAT
ncbi:MAG: AAA family ATPase [Chlamydiales bacterium]|nr:AAA family ATPase [Chlamydiales bacterium]